jgi:hypothetical protein
MVGVWLFDAMLFAVASVFYRGTVARSAAIFALTVTVFFAIGDHHRGLGDQKRVDAVRKMAAQRQSTSQAGVTN